MTHNPDPFRSRRAFLETVGMAAVGTAAGSALAAGLPGHLPQDTASLNTWLQSVTATALKSPQSSSPYRPSVAALADHIRMNGILRMHVTKMIQQVPEKHRTIHSVDELLRTLNHIVQTAPAYNDDPAKRNTFPISTLFVHMMFTSSGREAWENSKFNELIRGVLQEWCEYLDSPASCDVLNTGPYGWLSPSAVKLNKLDEFVIPDKSAPHWGFTSWNAYFHRQIRDEVRPLAGENDPRVIVSANDGTIYKISRGAKKFADFWIKSQPYSLFNVLDHHPMVDRFVGGDVFQSFLSGANYHRWRSPIAGRIIDTKLVTGNCGGSNSLMFSELEAMGFDPTGGTWSQGYEASVNTRGLVFIESDNPTIGVVVVVPIGITEISSVTISVNPGDRVGKGDELGYFSYGGSSMCVIFQPGAIKKFTVPSPSPGTDPDKGPSILVRQQIAVAN